MGGIVEMTFTIMSPLIVTGTGENLGNFPTGFWDKEINAQHALADNDLMGVVREKK